MKLKYEDVAKVGDRIRSYDFEGRKTCYIEGTVQRIGTAGDEYGFRAFVVLVDTDVWPHHSVEKAGRASGSTSNVPTRIGQIFYVPLEIAIVDWEGRIVKLPRSHLHQS